MNFMVIIPPKKIISKVGHTTCQQGQEKQATNKNNQRGKVMELYFSTNATRFSISSFDPSTSKKSSTIVTSTEFLVVAVRASDSSGWNMVAQEAR
jgi:hypothetical protein